MNCVFYLLQIASVVSTQGLDRSVFGTSAILVNGIKFVQLIILQNRINRKQKYGNTLNLFVDFGDPLWRKEDF